MTSSADSSAGLDVRIFETGNRDVRIRVSAPYGYSHCRCYETWGEALRFLERDCRDAINADQERIGAAMRLDARK